ncbi:nucleotidyltransferase domain-containing protein [Aliikangiella sp. IMCC44632]
MPTISLGDALFTKTQQRLLALLYGNPDRSYYLNELVRLADIGKGAVSRELTKMCDAGLLTVTRHGNQHHYQANANNPIFAELKQIVQKSFGIVDVVREALRPKLTKLELAFIYGSMAKGNEHAESDIDLMLVGSELSYSEAMALLDEAETQLGRSINPTLLTPNEFKQRVNNKQSFITRVMQQPKLWIKGEKLKDNKESL